MPRDTPIPHTLAITMLKLITRVKITTLPRKLSLAVAYDTVEKQPTKEDIEND